MDAVRLAPAAPREPRATICPPEAPLAMPVQSLRRQAQRAAARASAGHRSLARRCFVFGAALRAERARRLEMYLVLAVGGLTALEAVILALFVILFAWIALSFASTLGGLIALMTAADGSLDIDADCAAAGRSRRAPRCCCRPTTRTPDRVLVARAGDLRVGRGRPARGSRRSMCSS